MEGKEGGEGRKEGGRGKGGREREGEGREGREREREGGGKKGGRTERREDMGEHNNSYHTSSLLQLDPNSLRSRTTSLEVHLSILNLVTVRTLRGGHCPAH